MAAPAAVRAITGPPASLRRSTRPASSASSHTVRRGQDVLKALSLGADACFVGRAYAYGLAAAGEAGVLRSLRILESEMSATMALLGRNSVSELNRTVLMASNPP